MILRHFLYSFPRFLLHNRVAHRLTNVCLYSIQQYISQSIRCVHIVIPNTLRLFLLLTRQSQPGFFFFFICQNLTRSALTAIKHTHPPTQPSFNKWWSLSPQQTLTAAYIWTQMRLGELFMPLYDILIFMPLPTKITTAFEFSARN